MRLTILLTLATLALIVHPVAAQSSAGYRLTESQLDQGGNISTGVLLSTDYRVTLSSLGGSIDGWALASGADYQLQGGFVSAYPPPGEVHDLRFADDQALSWIAEPSIGTYQLYRGSLASLGGAFGSCDRGGLVASSTIVSATPATGQGWGFLVTARNRLGEEGVAGTDSSGLVRSQVAACP